MPNQFIRKVNLVVEGATDGLDLSPFHITFQTTQSDFQTLNTLTCRIYNLSDTTSQKIQKEYSSVMLQAGYKDGNIANIFNGTIKQVKRGRESQTETYTEIFAADGDDFYTVGTVNKTLGAGWNQNDVINQAVQSGNASAIAQASQQNVTIGNVQFASILNPAPRGKVMYGMARLQLRKATNSTLTSWSIQDGKVNVTPVTGYLGTEAVVLNSATGLIGLPEQTEDGLSVRCLLNPKIQIGTQIQINQSVIQQGSIPNDAIFLGLSKEELAKANFYPPISADGFYKVLVAEHVGDTRGNDYYTDIIALAINKTAAPNNSVKIAG